MVNMKVKLNEDKIEQDGAFDLPSLYSAIDALANKNHLIKMAQGEYASKGEQGFALVGRVVLTLVKTQWFTENVVEWVADIDGDIEDLLAHYKKSGVIQPVSVMQNSSMAYEH